MLANDLKTQLVNIDNRFLMNKYLVTQGEYEEIIGINPSFFKGDSNRPVETISWYNALEFCNKKSIKDGLEPVYIIDKTKKEPNNISKYDDLKWLIIIDKTKNGYRIPTEEEWEYAAKGGVNSKNYKYAGGNNSEEIGWHRKNSKRLTHTVGLKIPNEFGLFDMSGNVWEWCWDWYDIDYKVLRGGAWNFLPKDLYISSRNLFVPSYMDSYIGFRYLKSL